MSFSKIKISITKIILPILFRLFVFFKINSRTVNYLNEKKQKLNDVYNFEESLKKLIDKKKLIGLDVGSKGGFNSDIFFPKKYEKYFQGILVDPTNDNSAKEDQCYIKKGLWSSKEKKKLYILGKRSGSSSMYEPNKDSLKFYGYKEKDFHLFDITNTETVECDTISSSLNSLDIKNLDYLKIDTQGAELEILKGLGNYRPLMIKSEVQIYQMYKNVPSWSELLGYLNKLNYIICDWKVIGSHVTRTPVEMDMIFIPDFSREEGKKIILERQKEFICIMLISGQIKFLKKISEILDLKYSEFYKDIEDRYFY